MEMQARAILLVAVVAFVLSGCSERVKPKVANAAGQEPDFAQAERAIDEAPRDETRRTGEPDRDTGNAAETVAEATTPPFRLEKGRITALKPPAIRPAAMPEVVLSSSHLADCFVRVGDDFPEFRLSDVAGRTVALSEVQGELFTVVVFWSSDRLLSAEVLRFLDERIAPYVDLGVKVVTVNVGDSPTRAKQIAEESEGRSLMLLDAERRLFSQVGRGHLPRVYLLDRKGRVLWFDIEFSRDTREQLEQAIQASLKST